MNIRRLCLTGVLLAGCYRGGAPEAAPAGVWTGSWSSAQQLTEPRNLPPAPGLANSTLRQVVHLSLGGRALRVHLSNTFGTSAVTVRSARVARSAGGSAVVQGSDQELRFAGRTTIELGPGGSAVSDPVIVNVPPLADLAVSLWFGETSPAVTGHPGSRTTSFLQSGDNTTALSLPDAVPTEHWYILSGVDVRPEGVAAAVVTLGNSITDGRGSGTNRQNRWPDNLARRLQGDARTQMVAVLNGGIGGNAVLRGGLGPTALARFDRDVLEQRGVRWLIICEGVNDIGAASGSEAAMVATELIQAYQSLIARARRNGLRVYGATILPFGGSQYDDLPREAARLVVNQWIRSSGAWDAVIDFDAAMRDPQHPTRLRPDVDSGDHLHPNEAGYVRMAAAIDLALFVR